VRVGVQSNPAEMTRVRIDEFSNIRRIWISWMRFSGLRCAAECQTPNKRRVISFIYPEFVFEPCSAPATAIALSSPAHPLLGLLALPLLPAL
jgi:hypothetical protein